ncbi:glycosyltransferase [Ruegeria sediminis]|nr:glycosyltransferase [Ruegeria sediminis]
MLPAGEGVRKHEDLQVMHDIRATFASATRNVGGIRYLSYPSPEAAKAAAPRNHDTAAMLSVIMPCYNVEDYVADACVSVMANAVHCPLELIIVDDGGTDSTIAKAIEVLQQTDIPVIVVSIPNSGLSAARNVGVAHSSGKYITFLDSDDFVAPDLYRCLVDHAEYENCVQVFGRTSTFASDRLEDYMFTDFSSWDVILSGAFRRSFRPFSEPLVFFTEAKICGRIWLKSFFVSNNLWFPEGLIFEDVGVHLKSLALNQKIGVVNVQGLFYRAGRPKSLSLDRSRQRFDVIENYENALVSSDVANIPVECGAYALKQIIRICEWSRNEVHIDLKGNFDLRLAECYRNVPQSWVKRLASLDGDSCNLFLRSYKKPMNNFAKLREWSFLRRTKKEARKRQHQQIGWRFFGANKPGPEPKLIELFSFSDYREYGPEFARIPWCGNAGFFAEHDIMRAVRLARSRPDLTVFAVSGPQNAFSSITDALSNLRCFENVEKLVSSALAENRKFAWAALGEVHHFQDIGKFEDLEIQVLYGCFNPIQFEPAKLLKKLGRFAKKRCQLRQNDGRLLNYQPENSSGPAVSVVVPVYMVEEYLDACVESLSNQTLQDREIILVDDGSPDRSGEICDGWAERNPTIRVLHKENGGCASARQAGLEAARGEYVTFVDSDDWTAPTMLEKLYDLALVTGENVVEGGWSYAYPNGQFDDETPREAQTCYSTVSALSYRPLKSAILEKPTIWRRLYRRRFLNQYGITFETALPRFDDAPFQFKALINSKDVPYLDECCLFYRQQRVGQDVAADDDRLNVHFPILKMMRDYLSDAWDEKAYDYFLEIQFYMHNWALSKLRPEFFDQYELRAARDIFGPEQFESSPKTLRRLLKILPGERKRVKELYRIFRKRAAGEVLPTVDDIR